MPKALHTKWSKPGFALFVQVVETTCVISNGESCASWRAFRAAVTARGTPSSRKILESSAMVGAVGEVATLWSVPPIADLESMPVYWFTRRILLILEGVEKELVWCFSQ